MNDRIKGLPLLFLIALTLFIYAPVGGYDFLSYDDPGYVTGNNHVRAGLTRGGALWAFRDTSVGHWHPLTWLSHMADVHIYGLNPGGHHLTNLLLHLINTSILFFVLRQMTGLFRQSLFVAALFALHPLNVESVAWIAERKNVLSTFFWFATMGAYVRYVKSPDFLRYATVFILFALGLLAKPMLVTLPFVLLLLDYWPLRRWQEGNGGAGISLLLLEKAPLLFLTGISIVLTLWSAKTGGAMADADALPFSTRFANALVSYGTYLAKMLWPVKLFVFYPYPAAISLGKVFAAALLLAGITVFAFFQRRRFPFLVTGWLWYLGTLIPVIGLVQVGIQCMADRYAYVSLVGIFIMLVWGITDFIGQRLKGSVILPASAVFIIAALTVNTWFQVQYWQNSKSLFSHAVAVTQDNYLAHYHLGTALLGEGKRDAAIAHFLKAAEIKPDYEPAYNSIGIALQLEGRFSEARSYYRAAIEIKPDYGDTYYNLGTLFDAMGKPDEAIAAYRQAVKFKPESASIYNNLGVALTKKGQMEEAIVAFNKSLLLNPDYAGAHYNLALALKRRGFSEEYEAHIREAERLNFPIPGRRLP